jgi:hypothetical protein
VILTTLSRSRAQSKRSAKQKSSTNKVRALSAKEKSEKEKSAKEKAQKKKRKSYKVRKKKGRKNKSVREKSVNSCFFLPPTLEARSEPKCSAGGKARVLSKMYIKLWQNMSITFHNRKQTGRDREERRRGRDTYVKAKMTMCFIFATKTTEITNFFGN